MRLTAHEQNKHQPSRRRRRRTRRGRTIARLAAGCVLTAALILVSDASASAAVSASAEPGQVLAIADSVDEVLGNIRDWLMGILAALATVFLTVGGVIYMMAGGDPGQVERAKTAFKAAGMGYALAALAPLVVQVLEGIVGA